MEPQPQKISDIVLCLVCGLQHSGSTMLGELLRAAPGCESRFEAGLMAFDNFDQHRKSPFHGFLIDYWKLTPGQVEEIYAAPNIRQSYELLRSFAGFESQRIVDKAPRCSLRLHKILSICDIPVLFTVRDPRAILYSARKHRRWTLRVLADHYVSYIDGLTKARRDFDNRIRVVRYEELCRDPQKEAANLYDFLGLEWNPEFVELRDADPATRAKVQGGVSTNFIHDYRKHVSKEEQRELLKILGAKYSEFVDSDY